MNIKDYSIKREKKYAKENPDGRRRAMSGANPVAKGDFIREHFLEDIKSTEKKSFTLKLSDLEKINSDAIEHDRAGVLVIDFSSPDKQYYVVNAATYELLLKLLGGNNE